MAFVPLLPCELRHRQLVHQATSFRANHEHVFCRAGSLVFQANGAALLSRQKNRNCHHWVQSGVIFLQLATWVEPGLFPHTYWRPVARIWPLTARFRRLHAFRAAEPFPRYSPISAQNAISALRAVQQRYTVQRLAKPSDDASPVRNRQSRLMAIYCHHYNGQASYIHSLSSFVPTRARRFPIKRPANRD